MSRHPLVRPLASSDRRKILAPLAASALLGSMLLLPNTAGALPPDGGSGPTPRPPGIVSLTATSYLGSVTIYNGLSATRAMQNAPIVLRGSNTNGRQPLLRITETSYCNYASRPVRVISQYAGWYIVPDPETRCYDGLYEATVTVSAVDQVTGPSTGDLTIKVYGPQWYDDRLPSFDAW